MKRALTPLMHTRYVPGADQKALARQGAAAGVAYKAAPAVAKAAPTTSEALGAQKDLERGSVEGSNGRAITPDSKSARPPLDPMIQQYSDVISAIEGIRSGDLKPENKRELIEGMIAGASYYTVNSVNIADQERAAQLLATVSVFGQWAMKDYPSAIPVNAQLTGQSGSESYGPIAITIPLSGKDYEISGYDIKQLSGGMPKVEAHMKAFPNHFGLDRVSHEGTTVYISRAMGGDNTAYLDKVAENTFADAGDIASGVMIAQPETALVMAPIAALAKIGEFAYSDDKFKTIVTTAIGGKVGKVGRIVGGDLGVRTERNLDRIQESMTFIGEKLSDYIFWPE